MKLSKVKFMDSTHASELSKDEQKLIFGGYDTGSSCCFYVTDGGTYSCTPNPDKAYSSAGGTYKTWACNTAEVKQRCHC